MEKNIEGLKDWTMLQVLSLLLLSEWTWDGAVWDSGTGGRDQPGYRESGRVGCSSARREEPPNHIRWGLCAAGASGSGAHHWSLELPLGCHPAAAGGSYCCWYWIYPYTSVDRCRCMVCVWEATCCNPLMHKLFVTLNSTNRHSLAFFNNDTERNRIIIISKE